MEYDIDAVAEATLALMYLTQTHKGVATWKGYPWEATERLHELGYLENPATKNKSIYLTKEGQAKSAELFRKMFAPEP